jgi:hypothetical protein
MIFVAVLFWLACAAGFIYGMAWIFATINNVFYPRSTDGTLKPTASERRLTAEIDSLQTTNTALLREVGALKEKLHDVGTEAAGDDD